MLLWFATGSDVSRLEVEMEGDVRVSRYLIEGVHFPRQEDIIPSSRLLSLILLTLPYTPSPNAQSLLRHNEYPKPLFYQRRRTAASHAL